MPQHSVFICQHLLFQLLNFLVALKSFSREVLIVCADILRLKCFVLVVTFHGFIRSRFAECCVVICGVICRQWMVIPWRLVVLIDGFVAWKSSLLALLCVWPLSRVCRILVFARRKSRVDVLRSGIDSRSVAWEFDLIQALNHWMSTALAVWVSFSIAKFCQHS